MDHPTEKHIHTSSHNTEKESSHEFSYPINDVKTLLEWSAASRPYRKRKRAFYINILLLTGTLLVILFLFSQYLLMLVIISLSFVSFALASTPPNNNQYRLSTEGIAIEDHFYLWQELYDFYFKKRGNEDILHIRTKAYFPGELIMMLGDISKEKMRSVLIHFLPYREIVQSTFTEKAGDWLTRTFPLDDSHQS